MIPSKKIIMMCAIVACAAGNLQVGGLLGGLLSQPGKSTGHLGGLTGGLNGLSGGRNNANLPLLGNVVNTANGLAGGLVGPSGLSVNTPLNAVGNVVYGVARPVLPIASQTLDTVTGLTSGVPFVGGVAEGAVNTVTGVVGGLGDPSGSGIPAVGGLLSSLLSKSGSAVPNTNGGAATSSLDNVLSQTGFGSAVPVAGVTNNVNGITSGVVPGAMGGVPFVGDLTSGVTGVLGGLPGQVNGALNGVVNFAGGAVKDLGGVVSSVGQNIQGLQVPQVSDVVNSLTNLQNSIARVQALASNILKGTGNGVNRDAIQKISDALSQINTIATALQLIVQSLGGTVSSGTSANVGTNTGVTVQ